MPLRKKEKECIEDVVCCILRGYAANPDEALVFGQARLFLIECLEKTKMNLMRFEEDVMDMTDYIIQKVKEF